MTNVNGNWKGGKSLVKYSRTRALKAKGTQAAGQIARSYKRYVKPSTNLLKGAGKIALGAGKLALRFPGTTLVAAGLGLGFKRAVRKSSRSLKFSPYNQFDKKARKRI